MRKLRCVLCVSCLFVAVFFFLFLVHLIFFYFAQLALRMTFLNVHAMSARCRNVNQLNSIVRLVYD